MRPIKWHLENNWKTEYQSPQKRHIHSKVTPPPSQMVATRRQCASRSTITPTKSCSADLSRCIKKGVGCSLRGTDCKRDLVSPRKQIAYKLSGTKSSLLGPKRVPRPLFRGDSSCSNRQHHSSGLHKQGRRHELRLTVCPSMKDPELVFQKTGYRHSPTHSRPAECGSRKAIQARPDHSDRGGAGGTGPR